MRAIPKKSAATPKDYVLKAYYKDLEQWAEDAVNENDKKQSVITNVLKTQIYLEDKIKQLQAAVYGSMQAMHKKINKLLRDKKQLKAEVEEFKELVKGKNISYSGIEIENEKLQVEVEELKKFKKWYYELVEKTQGLTDLNKH